MGRSNSVNSLFIIAEVEDKKTMMLTWGHSQYKCSQSICDSYDERCRAWISRRFLNNQGPGRTSTRVCTSSLVSDAGQILGLSARRVVRSHLEASAEMEGVNYLVGMLVVVHRR
jgi:hypothetical protein